MFRLAAVAQGIAARVAARQASSAQAKEYAGSRSALAEMAWRLVEEAWQVEEREGEKEGEGEGEREGARAARAKL
jgi:hypothetical protein